MSLLPEIDHFLCRVLRGESPAWPAASGPDFAQDFLQQARYHGVQALVFDHARNTGEWAAWPQQVRDELTHTLRMETAYDLLRVHKVSTFLAGLSQQNVFALMIKGEALARTLYPNSGLRARCDTDLFIDLADISCVRETLLASGFEIVPPIYKSHQFMAVWRSPGAATGKLAVTLDIHWRILNAPQFARVIGFTEALEQSVPVPGMPGCRTLGNVDALLLACMHRKGSLTHDEDRLIWLYDLHLLVSALTSAQLAEFADRAVNKNVQAACLDGLRQAKACFHTEIPTATLQQLAAANTARGMSRRIHESNLSLLIDDWSQLPTFTARRAMLSELFLPSGESLLRKYGKQNRNWLPLLYIRQIFGGLVQRLTLR